MTCAVFNNEINHFKRNKRIFMSLISQLDINCHTASLFEV